MDDQLVALERGPQLGLDVEALAGVATAERVEHCDPQRRVALGADQRNLGLLQHVAAARRARRAHSDAHARADEPRPPVDVERRLELQLHALRERHRRVGVALEHEDREGVPTEARHRVVRPEDGRDPGADLAQDAVAGRVAEALVHDLEAVDVEQHDRDRSTVDADRTGGQGVDDPLDERLACWQAGDRIMR